MAITQIKPMMESKAYVMRERESYKIPEAVWREHLGQGGDKQILYEIEAGGVVKRKHFRVSVHPEGDVLCGEVLYNLDVDTVENFEVKGWVGMGKSGTARGWLRDGEVSLTEFGVSVSFSSRLEEREEPYNQANFVKQHLDDGHFIFDVDIEIAVRKEKLKVDRRESKLLEDFTLICKDQEWPCHKAMLQARSTVFKQGIEFNEGQGLPEASTEYEIKDSNPLAVNLMLSHIYGWGPISKMDNIYIDSIVVKEGLPSPEDLLHLANYFNLPELVKICKEGLIWRMTPKNAVETLVNIDKHVSEDKEAKDKVISFIKKHAKDVIKSEGWGIFVQNYSDLVTDIFWAMATSE